MKKILIISRSRQRSLDTIIFIKKLQATRADLDLYVYITQAVYDEYKPEYDKLQSNLIFENEHLHNLSQKTNLSVKDRLRVLARKILPMTIKRIVKKIHYYITISRFYESPWSRKENAYYQDLQKKYGKIKKMLTDKGIEVVFIPGDRDPDLEAVFLKVCQDINIPTIIPYMVNFADEDRMLRLKERVKPLYGWWVSSYIKESQRNSKQKPANNGQFFYPHYIANALDRFGALPTNPWVMGSGLSDILCLDSAYSKDLYVSKGVSAAKIRVVGDISFDTLYTCMNMRNDSLLKISEKYHLDSTKQIILCALPQLGEHNLLPWNRHWEEIEYLASCLSKTGQSVLISLHPKMDRSQYTFLEKKYSCVILDERLSAVLPAANVFVSTFSSTVPWAVLCGVKTIVVDFYDFNYTMYDHLKSIIILREKEKLQPTFSYMLRNPVDFAHDWVLLSRGHVFDGKTIQRYVGLIDEVFDHKIHGKKQCKNSPA